MVFQKRPLFSSWWFQPIWKYAAMLVKLDHFPRGENKKYLKPPPNFSRDLFHQQFQGTIHFMVFDCPNPR